MKRDGDCRQQCVWGMRGQIRFQLRHFLGQVKLCRSFQTHRQKSSGSSGSRSAPPPAPTPRPFTPATSSTADAGHGLLLQESALETEVSRRPVQWQMDRPSFQEVWLRAGGVMYVRTEGEAGCGGHPAGPLPPCPWDPGLLTLHPPESQQEGEDGKALGADAGPPCPSGLAPTGRPPKQCHQKRLRV